MKNGNSVLEAQEPITAAELFAEKVPVHKKHLSEAEIFLRVQEVLSDVLELERDEIRLGDELTRDLDMQPSHAARIRRGLEDQFAQPDTAIVHITFSTVSVLVAQVKDVLEVK